MYVDGVVLVLGGSDATLSGGPYLRPALRDGAALDLSTRTWRPIASAPWPPAESSAHVVVGDRVLLARNGPGAWLVYDRRADTWRRVPSPPTAVPQPTMAVRGQRVFVLDRYVEESPAPVQVLNLATDTWSALPASRHRPAIDGRTVVTTDSGLVVMGGDLSPRQAGRHRQPALAETWDGSRWRRFHSDHAAGLDWHWTGRRVISTYRVTRRDSAMGGLHEFRASAFDPATGRWEQLPWLPSRQHGLLEDTRASAEGRLVLSGGHLYDDRTGRSVPIENPSQWWSRTGVLTDDAVVLVGGARPKPGQPPGRLMRLELTRQAWLLPLGHHRQHQRRADPRPRRGGDLSASELAKAVAVARAALDSQHATISSATVTAGPGTVTGSNTRHPCTSGRLLRITLIGSFPRTGTTGHDVRPGEPLPDFTVRALLITADARSGLACRVGVQTAEDEPTPEPGATILHLG